MVNLKIKLLEIVKLWGRGPFKKLFSYCGLLLREKLGKFVFFALFTIDGGNQSSVPIKDCRILENMV